MRIGILEPHLERYGGIRRMLEFANRLVARGHDVRFYVPPGPGATCTWMACDATVRTLPEGYDDALDVVIFTHEPQWYLLERFTKARRRIFYALHDGSLYEKPGSWESAYTEVDLQLANSGWTADRLAALTGHRPIVALGGVNRDVFRPHDLPERYPILCTGERRRAWKGTDTILDAGRLLGVPVAGYTEMDLAQPELGEAYASCGVFAVGSWFEGFGQPGLEALACGAPLVTTDNGGCREYAIDGETALVVPPRDTEAMARAIGRLLEDRALARRLRANGLELVARDFDWEARTDELAEVLDGVVAGTALAPPPPRPEPPLDPDLSIVVLAWDNLGYTQQFVQSVRQHTDRSHELIIVDNGSAPDAAAYARQAGDRVILNRTNLGFAKGMNQGLTVARGRHVAFCNNDTILPPGWAGHLLETAERHPDAGIVVPALTAARNTATVRDEPGEAVEVLDPFSAPPAAVIYLMRTDEVRALGAWEEEYVLASGEDVDLCFKVWVNDLDIVFDERVLVAHVGKGTASRLDDWRKLWADNRRHFLDKWSGPTPIVRLDRCDPDRHARNRATARAVAGWMDRYFTTRDEQATPIRQLVAADGVLRTRVEDRARTAWRSARPHLPPIAVQALTPVVRRLKPAEPAAPAARRR